MGAVILDKRLLSDDGKDASIKRASPRQAHRLIPTPPLQALTPPVCRGVAQESPAHSRPSRTYAQGKNRYLIVPGLFDQILAG